MRLSNFTDYSLRVLIYVGLWPKDRTSIADIADVFLSTLDQYTLAALLGPSKKVAVLLSHD